MSEATKKDFETIFQEQYEWLNDQQRAAVDAIEGPVMVVAGPGTGKTQILTLRIANILRQTDTEPENILALTFTEAAATNMRGRLARYIGAAAHRVSITTFHGFANEVIQNYSEAFPHIIGSVPVVEVEQIQILEKIIQHTELELLKPFGDTFYYLRSVRSAIDTLKREGVTSDEFRSVVEKARQTFEAIPDRYYESGAHAGKMKGKYKDEERRLQKNEELVVLYEKYQDELRQAKRYDFADMLVELLRALRSNDDLRLQLQETYHYVLVDEHQDSNNAQNKILEQLMGYHEQPNIFVVGDEKQAIFRFQGASLENFYYFKHQYPEAVLITLQQNYRSTQTILSSADSLLSGEVSLVGNRDFEEVPIGVYALSDPAQEIFFVAHDIKQRIAAGVPAEEIAVLYRNNSDIFALADMFDRIGVPYSIESDQDIMSHPAARQLLDILRGIVWYGEDKDLARLLHLDLMEIDHLDAFKLIRSAGQKRKYQLYDLLRDKALRKDLHLANDEAVQALFANLETWITLSQEKSARAMAAEVLRSSGLLQKVLSGERSQESLQVIQKILGLIDELSEGKPDFLLRDFFGYLDTIREHNVSVRIAARGRQGQVRCMTVHRSKGLEFDYVYITQAHAGRFGGKKRRELLPLVPEVYQLYEGQAPLDTSSDDERRLFYVALTRARKHIIVSYTYHDEAGKELLPSVYLEEIESDYLEHKDTAAIEEVYAETHGLLVGDVQPNTYLRVEDQEYVAHLFQKTGFSVSALNNYLKSPWQYFYRNLLRIPEPPNKHQAYGIAVHAALHDLFERLKHERTIADGAVFVQQRFLESLDQQHYLSASEYAEAKQKGLEQLGLWYEAHYQNWNTDTLNELRIPSVYLEQGIRLTGVLDKVELISENEVHVVDYKTGKPKTRNDIMGNTASSTGDYYRQLVFYKLLLRHYQGGRYSMKTGEIVFVQPDTAGKFRNEVFEISDDEVDALEQEIYRVAEEITTLAFWNQECDPAQCDYCDLVAAIKKHS